jgi:C-terminal processing protease CtpA/Prc
MRELDYLAKISKPKDARDYTFEVVGNATGYLNFKSMANYDHFVVFCDSVFQSINQRYIRKLVVDLRENGGGNSALGMYLLNYITKKPYRMAGNSERKVSQQFKDQILKPANRQLYGDTYDEYLKMKNGEFWQVGGNDLVTPDIIKNRFTGRVCFLIGPYTFSSANMLAATIKDYNLAPLIGEPTGEPGNDYGELCTIKLPQTGWITFTSTTYWVRPNTYKKDKFTR